MSHSPAAEGQSPSDAYRKGWEALFEMLYAGGSLSGRERKCCFLNTGATPFADISAVAGVDFDDDGRAIGVVDWDLDGALDLWLINRTAPRARFLRNVVRNGHAYLAIRLEGRGCNRDAIGARVEVHLAGPAGRMLLKTLRAGEGYLAQSSKWLHFGLGSNPSIERVAVRWPDGLVEQFTGLRSDRRYRIVQGMGKADEWSAKARRVRLEPSELSAPPATERARLVLAGRVPLPNLLYSRFNGAPARLYAPGRPALINIWASWCGPCRQELAELAGQQPALARHGLDVVAISVDQQHDWPQANSVLGELSWPFAAGGATSRVVDTLDTVQRALLNRRQPMPVPTSFLVDARGQLAAIYKGPVRIEELLDDLRLLDAAPREVLKAALPFAGQWHHEPSVAGLSQLAVADQLIKAGYTELGEQYLAGLTSGVDIQLISSDAQARTLVAGAQLNLGVKLAGQGNTARAMDAFQKALQFDPRFAKAHYNLGIALQNQGRLDEAIDHYRRAIESQPAHAEAHYNLGHALVAQGQTAQAVEHFQAAVQARPDFAEAHDNLGHVLLVQKNLDEAIHSLRRAIQIQPQLVSAQYNLGNALLARGELDEAIDCFRQVLKLEPAHADAHTNLASALRAQGKTEEAIEQFSLALAGRPHDAKMHYNLGAALVTSGQVEAALEHLREAVRLQPDSLTPIDALAKTLAAAERFEEAQAAAEKALALAIAAGERELADEIRKRLEAYRARSKPRESSDAREVR